MNDIQKDQADEIRGRFLDDAVADAQHSARMGLIGAIKKLQELLAEHKQNYDIEDGLLDVIKKLGRALAEDKAVKFLETAREYAR